MCLTNIKKPKVAEEEIITYKVLCISNGVISTPFYQHHVELQKEYSKPMWCDDELEAATEDEIDGLVFHVFANEEDAEEMALKFNRLSVAAGDSHYHRRYFIVKTIIPRGANMPFGVYASASPKIRVPVMLDFQSLPMANENFPDSKVDSEDIVCWSKRKRSYSQTIDTVFLEKVRFLGIDEKKYNKWPGFMERNIDAAAENYARDMSNEFIKPEAIKKMFKAGAMWMKNMMAILLLSLVLLSGCKKEEPIPVEKETQEKTELNPWIFDFVMLYH